MFVTFLDKADVRFRLILDSALGIYEFIELIRSDVLEINTLL